MQTGKTVTATIPFDQTMHDLTPKILGFDQCSPKRFTIRDPAMTRQIPAIDKLRTMRRTPLAAAIALALASYPRA